MSDMETRYQESLRVLRLAGEIIQESDSTVLEIMREVIRQHPQTALQMIEMLQKMYEHALARRYGHGGEAV